MQRQVVPMTALDRDSFLQVVQHVRDPVSDAVMQSAVVARMHSRSSNVLWSAVQRCQ